MTQDSSINHPQRCYLVCGRVQRVGFRYATYREANALGLSGYVRNLADGRVEICAAGSDEQLQKLFQWLHVGPLMSRVDDVAESSCDKTLGPGFGMR